MKDGFNLISPKFWVNGLQWSGRIICCTLRFSVKMHSTEWKRRQSMQIICSVCGTHNINHSSQLISKMMNHMRIRFRQSIRYAPLLQIKWFGRGRYAICHYTWRQIDLLSLFPLQHHRSKRNANLLNRHATPRDYRRASHPMNPFQNQPSHLRSCQRYVLFVSFRELRWDDWVNAIFFINISN